MASPTKKSSKGRQRVEMVRMEKDSNRQVTFSKRRNGLFKKASELSTLCGAEVAIIVFSPGRKAFSFGHPSVETVINRFMINSLPPSNSTEKDRQPLVEDHCDDANLCDLNIELTLLNNRMEVEKKRGEGLNEMYKKARKEHFWWDAPTEELVLPHLDHLRGSLEELREKVIQQGNNLMLEVPIRSAPFLGIEYPMVGFHGGLINLNAPFHGYDQGYYQP